MDATENKTSTIIEDNEIKSYSEFLTYLDVDLEDFKLMYEAIDFDDYSR